MSEAFTAAHGVEVADVIMEHLPSGDRSELATKSDLSTQGLLLRSDFNTCRDELKPEISDLGGDLRASIAELRKKISEAFAKQVKRMVSTMAALISVLVVVAN